MSFVLLLTVCTSAAIHGLVILGVFENMELDELDRQLDWLPHLPLPESDVTLVWITEEEIQKYGHPISDDLLSEALGNLLKLQPRAIGIDLYRDKPVLPGNVRLRKILTTQANIIIVEKLPNTNQPGVSAPAFMPQAQVGFSDIPLDKDGVVRRMFLMMWDADDRPYLSFALQLALRHLAHEGLSMAAAPTDPSHVMLGQSILPPLESDFGGYSTMDAGGYQLILDQRRVGTGIPELTLDDLLANTIQREAVENKTVVLATSSPSVKDFFNTSNATVVYGGEIHALNVDQLIRYARGTTQPLGSRSTGVEFLWLALWCLLGSASGDNTRNPIFVGIFVLLGLGAIAGISVLSLNSGIWLPLVAPGIGWLVAFGLGVAIRSRQEKTEKEQMLQLFGRFVSRRIVSEVWDHREEFMDGERPRPQRAAITVIQCDLSGFVTASASIEPDKVMRWVGVFMESMAELVEFHGGVVSDFTGDGLMAWFGVPLIRTRKIEIETDAINAVRCALDMSTHLEQLNFQWSRDNLPTARMRVGICSGEAVVGAYGSRYRLKYASVGTTVNTAARLEGYDKDSFYQERTGNRILVSGATWQLLGDRFPGTSLGDIHLRGLPESIPIYRILESQHEYNEQSEENLVGTVSVSSPRRNGTGN